MPYEELTKQNFGNVGANQAVDVVVVTLPNPGPGRYRIWGYGRHSVVNGLRLKIGTTNIIVFAGAGGSIITMGPVVVDINNNTDNIIIDLNAATGASDSAMATIYAQKVS